uniref:Putative secreted peptide n=1 Tax=Anopheles braziliensis TaxID=58242 RepID=A0A2M3ZPG9_9DIPT
MAGMRIIRISTVRLWLLRLLLLHWSIAVGRIVHTVDGVTLRTDGRCVLYIHEAVEIIQLIAVLLLLLLLLLFMQEHIFLLLHHRTLMVFLLLIDRRTS